MAALITTNKGPIIGIFNQYANYGKGLTVHSVNQLKQFGILIDDTPRCLHGGKQGLETPNGYFIHINIRNGLPYIDMSLPSDTDMDLYPHDIFTSDLPCSPQILDSEYLAKDMDLTEDDIVQPTYHTNTLNAFG